MARSRSGCLGSFIRLAAMLVLCGVVLAVIPAVFQPWGFYSAARSTSFRIGRVGHDEVADGRGVRGVRRHATKPPTRLGNAYLTGVGYICTPKHERIGSG
jgi:hypothetical protein